MMSSEENFYAQQQGADEGEWKGGPMQGPPHASKLNTWSNKRGNKGQMFQGGPPHNYNGTDPKGGWQDGNRHTPSDQNKIAWSDPLQDQQQMFDSICDDVFSMNLGGQVPKMGPGPPNNGNPHQWGRGEINQSTPWDIDSSRGGANFNPDGLPNSAPRFVSMDNGTGQWRSWEHDGNFQKDFHHGAGFPPHMGGPGKMHGGNFYNGAGGNNFMMQQGFNDRMMRNGPPHMQPNANQQQPWMGDKYGGGNRFQAYGAPPQAPMNMVPPSMVGQRGAFMAPPPLGAPPHPGMQHPPMHQMPPNPHMTQPAPGHQQGGGQFNVGTFSAANMGMGNMGNFQPTPAPVPPVNDDSVWHDPNGDLRKWQRDTGTAAWGDPTKQTGQQIRRWQQVDENDPLGGNSGSVSQPVHSASSLPQQQSPDLKKSTEGEEEATETGWGDLPPLNGGAPIPHAPPPGPGPQLGANGAWMGGSQPQPLAAQNPNAPPPAVWADPQRSIASTNMPPAAHGGNFYNANPAPGSGTPTDWTRSNFGFNGAPQMMNTFENAPTSGSAPTSIVPGQDAVPGSTNEIADKLRMAASKGWIDPQIFCSNNKLSTQTASLLNTLINRLTTFEQNNVKIDQLKRQEASGAANANGSPQRAELERLMRETSQINNELAELREKIHMSVESQRANKTSLVDELSNMNTMSIGDVAPLW